MASKVDKKALISQLNLDEKISLLAGKNFWETQEIPRLGIPSLKTSDGPNGARGATFIGGITSACFPASVSLAATFDMELARRIGGAIAEETLTKGARVILGPTVCPHRHPLGGRNFESFSEDPLLAGKLSSQYIQGVQDKGVGATIKHFAANEQETKRFTMNANISEKALREIYLKPFEIAIKESKPWAVMTSYNLINGIHSDMSEWLLKQVLREEWGWNGLCMSDWGGTNSVAQSINAGLALEMPGPANQRKVARVKAAIEAGELAESTIDERVDELLELMIKTGKFEHPETPDEQAINNPEHQKLIREAGARGIVLLKNENSILPLKADGLEKLAVLGLAKTCLAHGGGSASVNCHYRVTPYEALEKALGNKVELLFAEGAKLFRVLPQISENATDMDGKPGFTITTYALDTLSKVGTRNNPNSSFYSLEEKFSGFDMEGVFKPPTSGRHYLEIASMGACKFFINDELVSEITNDAPDPLAFLLGGAEGQKIRYQFEAGKEYKIKIVTKSPATNAAGFALMENICGVSLGMMYEQDFETDLLDAAVEIAKSAETALVFVGNTPAWETEGRDMDTMNLPANGSQDRLIEAVAAVNSNVIVVNSTGVAIAMPWLGKVRAVVQAWFPGQEAGNSIVDVLTGAVNPSGRLPATFPRRLEDTPAYGNFPGDEQTLQVDYKEGSFIGHRYYANHPEKVLFPFGFGLSYTTYDIGYTELIWGESTGPTANGSSTLIISAEVKNTGSVAGYEVVQVYVAPPSSGSSMDQRKLVGFATVHLQPGEKKTASVTFGSDTFAEFDEGKKQWLVAAGNYKVEVAVSAAKKDIKATKAFDIAEDYYFAP